MRSYKIELKLNKSQRVLCAKSAGTSRFAYNWQLQILNEKYQKAKQDANGEKVKCKLGTAIDWHKDWVVLKDELPWIRETSKCCGQEALRDLEISFKRFFTKKSGYPKFKKRGEKDSFRLTGAVYIASNYVQLPIIGKVKLKEKNYPILEGKCLLKQATVSRQADRWFVSFLLPETLEDIKLPLLNEIKSEDINVSPEEYTIK